MNFSNTNLTTDNDEIKRIIEENKELKAKNAEFLVMLKELKLSNDNVMSKLNSIDERVQSLESKSSQPSKKTKS